MSEHDRDTGYKVFGGYEFNKYFAVEAGYFNLGKCDFQADTLPQGTLNGSLKAQGANVDAVFSLPFTASSPPSPGPACKTPRSRTPSPGSGDRRRGGPHARPEARQERQAGAGLQDKFTETASGCAPKWSATGITDAVGTGATSTWPPGPGS